MATVAELKQAVEGVFSHLPKKGPGKVSWLHEWGHFCLCYGGQKLVTDDEHIIDYGIKDSDQEFKFLCNMCKSTKSVYNLDDCRVLDESLSKKMRRKNRIAIDTKFRSYLKFVLLFGLFTLESSYQAIAGTDYAGGLRWGPWRS